MFELHLQLQNSVFTFDHGPMQWWMAVLIYKIRRGTVLD